MTKISKKQPKPHLLVVDTNVLWCEDKACVVAPAFDSFWNTYSKDFKLELIIPKVVQGELLFQQSTSAIKSMKKAAEEMEKISRITDKQYSHRITEHDIKGRVEKRFDKWLKSKNGRLVEAPISKINWDDLIHHAVWREPPFVFDPNNRDSEKGFRDALILETLIDVCREEHREIGIVFLCNDKLLRETAQHKLASNRRFDCYESVGDFESYLKLTREELTDQFIKSLIRKATEKFYSKGDPKCLYFRENLRTRLREEHKKFFDNPEESAPLSFRSRLTLYPEMWEAMDDGMFRISVARFEKVESDKEYYWMTEVRFVRQYRRRYAQGGLLISLESMFKNIDVDRVLVLPFYVFWKANIGTGARFRDITLLKIELKGNTFAVPTEEQRRMWNLRSIESLAPVPQATSGSGSVGP